MTKIIFISLLGAITMEIHGALHGKMHDIVIDREKYPKNIDDRHEDKDYDAIQDKNARDAVDALEFIKSFNNITDLLASCPSGNFKYCKKIIETMSEPDNVEKEAPTALGLFSFIKNIPRNLFNFIVHGIKSVASVFGWKSGHKGKVTNSTQNATDPKVHGLKLLPKRVDRRFLDIELDDHAIDVLTIAKLFKNTKDLRKLCPNDEYETCINLIRKLSNTKNIREQIADVYNLIWILNHNHHVAEVCPITNLKKCIEFLESLGDHENVIKAINEIHIKSTGNDYGKAKYLAFETHKQKKPTLTRNNGLKLDHGASNGGHRVHPIVLFDTKNTFIYHEDD